MSFDTSRFTFDPWKNYTGVVMEQGRVQLDSDWNDWLNQLNRRTQAGTLDAIGSAAYPATTPFAFQISFDSLGNLVIGPGRMYVDGLLAENHGDPTTVTWDPALGEMSNTPQPPPTTQPTTGTGAIEFLKQPWFPTAALPTDLTVPYLAYLDVWQRAVTWLEDPTLIDPAVGIDTTGRLQTVWQVKFAPVAAGATCATAGSPYPPASSGLLSTAPVISTPSGPCCLTINTGFTGMENQNYRVEINTPGPIGTATFKWSRDNASVETGVLGIAPATNSVGVGASRLTVLSMGRDQVLGFAPGNWIEILDDDLELAGLPGDLHQIDTIDLAGKTITLNSPASASFPLDGSQLTIPGRHTRIRRWDQSGTALTANGDILVPAAGTPIQLESGITVTFSLSSATGIFNTGDYWTFIARTADGSLETLTDAPPRGIHHHYTSLSVVDFTTDNATDCRPPADTCACDESCGCCTVTVGPAGSGAQFTSINTALAALPTAGGEVCILPGLYYEDVLIDGLHDVVIHGCGYQTRIASLSLNPTPTPSPAAAPTPEEEATGVGLPTTTAPAATSAPAGTFNAVISITASQHIQLRNFAVEADTDAVGILIDGTGDLIDYPTSTTTTDDNLTGVNQPNPGRFEHFLATVDITVEDIFLTASTLPAILAKAVRLLHIDDNRIAMENVRSIWPAVWVSGQEIHIDRNYVGIQSAAILREWMPTSVVEDLRAESEQGTVGKTAAKVSSPSAGLTGTVGSAKHSFGTKAEAAKAMAQKHRVENQHKETVVGETFIPDTGMKILNAIDVSAYKLTVAKTPGGIQIAGPSREVFVIDNLIEGGRGNGITLGSYDILDANGDPTGTTVGVTTVHEDPCSTTGTLQNPSSTTGTKGHRVVAGGQLVDILIDHNRILSMGLCGIGPVGYFDLHQIFEIISIRNLTITANTITDTLLRPVAGVKVFGNASSSSQSFSGDLTGTADAGDSTFGDSGFDSAGSTSAFSAIGSLNTEIPLPYGAISVPSVENLVIRDNAITNFGAKPGIQVNGIFILMGEMVEISRNQILETRDWTATASEVPANAGTLHGGIVILLVTPPPTTSKLTLKSFAQSAFEPGMPALRIQENVVRIPLGQALIVLGLGPFSISNNHFTCGGLVRGRGHALAQTVLILNLGSAIDDLATVKPSSLYGEMQGAYTVQPSYAAPTLIGSPNGTVLFTDNICQLEARVDRQRSYTSLVILSLDHIIFSNNHLWLDGGRLEVYVDAVLFARTLNVIGNRFQETLHSVLLSGVTFGKVNITGQNISTHCLLVLPAGATTLDVNNIALVSAAVPDKDPCARFRQL